MITNNIKINISEFSFKSINGINKNLDFLKKWDSDYFESYIKSMNLSYTRESKNGNSIIRIYKDDDEILNYEVETNKIFDKVNVIIIVNLITNILSIKKLGI